MNYNDDDSKASLVTSDLVREMAVLAIRSPQNHNYVQSPIVKIVKKCPTLELPCYAKANLHTSNWFVMGRIVGEWSSGQAHWTQALVCVCSAEYGFESWSLHFCPLVLTQDT